MTYLDRWTPTPAHELSVGDTIRWPSTLSSRWGDDEWRVAHIRRIEPASHGQLFLDVTMVRPIQSGPTTLCVKADQAMQRLDVGEAAL